MTNIIKQIEDAVKRFCNEGVYDSRDTKTIKAALTVLQRIASGDDWFDIESCQPKDVELAVLYERNDSAPSHFEKTRVKLTYHPHSVLCSKDGVRYEKPTHWKHIDGHKHIQMLMEEEMKG